MANLPSEVVVGYPQTFFELDALSTEWFSKKKASRLKRFCSAYPPLLWWNLCHHMISTGHRS